MMQYSILIFIIIAAIAGLNFALKRHFQAFIQTEADEHIRQPIPTIWQSSLKFSTQTATQDRVESVGGDTVVTSDMQSPYTVLSTPPPPVAPGKATLHVQDAASAPQKQDNPTHNRKEHETVLTTIT